MLRRSDESAYSIVPSRMSSRVSKSNCRNCTGGISIASADITHRQLSFEHDLFTARAFKTNYRNHLFNSTRQPLKPSLLSGPWVKSTAPSVDVGTSTPDTNQSLQVHVQKEFAKKQAKQSRGFLCVKQVDRLSASAHRRHMSSGLQE